MSSSLHKNSGFTLIEVLLALVMAALLFAGLLGVIANGLAVHDDVVNHNAIARDARFALQRMVRAVSHSQRLLLPLAENPATAYSESVREPGVLAVTLDPTLDRDRDGWADANNDRDFLDLNNNSVRDAGEPERIDEDPGSDNINDGAHGIVGIDDDNDGSVDEGPPPDPFGKYLDNDEDGAEIEDELNGKDDDLDGAIDEDLPGDMNNDGEDGLIGVDDDRDGSIDENPPPDDDEDGNNNEDWFDPVVYYLNGTDLIERLPAINPSDGADFTETVIAGNITRFRVERLDVPGSRRQLVELMLDLSDAGGKTVSLQSRVRVGGAL